KKGWAFKRSARLGGRRHESHSIAVILMLKDQKVPWFNGSQPSKPNNAAGLNQLMPHGPCNNHCCESQPASAIVGNNRVYNQITKPSNKPTSTPRRLAPCQYKPPIRPGANWATATKVIKP